MQLMFASSKLVKPRHLNYPYPYDFEDAVIIFPCAKSCSTSAYRSEINEAGATICSLSSLALYGVHQVAISTSPKLMATSSVTPPILEVVVFQSSTSNVGTCYSCDWPYKYGIALTLK
jgi:hypothetical protein